jgi:predicted DNA-binding WGR domain protein
MIMLTRIDLARNMRRFYALHTQPDLFGGVSVIKEWGRIGQPGTVRTTCFPSEHDAIAALDRAQSCKAARGYTQHNLLHVRS